MTAAPRLRSDVRHTARRSRQLKRAFLDQYRHFGNVSHCANLVGVGRATIYRWQEDDDEFAAAFRMADMEALEVLEQEAWRRAVQGSPYERTSYWHGQEVGTDRKIEYSDNLMALLLKAKAPDKYRDRIDIGSQVVIKALAGVDPAALL